MPPHRRPAAHFPPLAAGANNCRGVKHATALVTAGHRSCCRGIPLSQGLPLLLLLFALIPGLVVPAPASTAAHAASAPPSASLSPSSSPSSLDLDTLGPHTTSLPFPVDAVYTWVNGSDARLRKHLYALRVERGLVSEEERRQHEAEAEEEARGGSASTLSSDRYRDNSELRYSFRSLFSFAPWLRRVHLVTNGQVPRWLNLSHPRISLVTHAQIFANHTHLPTFSSPAIEANLHRIPGLARHFLYFNDDIMLGSPVDVSDWFIPASSSSDSPASSGTFRTYFEPWTLPLCPPKCKRSQIGNRICDAACNKDECGWDHGDCDGAETTSPSAAGRRLLQASVWESSIRFVHSVYNRRFGPGERHSVAHTPHFLDRELLASMSSTFPVEMERTSAAQLRKPTDMQFAFAFFHLAMHARKVWRQPGQEETPKSRGEGHMLAQPKTQHPLRGPEDLVPLPTLFVPAPLSDEAGSPFATPFDELGPGGSPTASWLEHFWLPEVWRPFLDTDADGLMDEAETARMLQWLQEPGGEQGRGNSTDVPPPSPQQLQDTLNALRQSSLAAAAASAFVPSIPGLPSSVPPGGISSAGVLSHPPLLRAIRLRFERLPEFSTVDGDRSQLHFFQLRTDVAQALHHLAQVERRRPKMICINDDMGEAEEAEERTPEAQEQARQQHEQEWEARIRRMRELSDVAQELGSASSDWWSPLDPIPPQDATLAAVAPPMPDESEYAYAARIVNQFGMPRHQLLEPEELLRLKRQAERQNEPNTPVAGGNAESVSASSTVSAPLQVDVSQWHPPVERVLSRFYRIQLVQMALQRFFQRNYPQPCPFELADGQENSMLHMEDILQEQQAAAIMLVEQFPSATPSPPSASPISAMSSMPLQLQSWAGGWPMTVTCAGIVLLVLLYVRLGFARACMRRLKSRPFASRWLLPISRGAGDC